MRQFSGATFLLCAVLAVGGAQATTLMFQDVADKARGADAVVHGKVLGAKARWSGDGRSIFTDTVIRVEETWKGEVTATEVTVRQPGGEVGDIGQRVEGVASLPVGQEVVLFLEARPGGAWLLYGMAQGKYRVERTSDGKEAFAIPEELGHTRLVDPLTRQEVTVTAEAVPLFDLRVQVAQAVGTAPEEGTLPPGTQKLPARTAPKPEPK